MDKDNIGTVHPIAALSEEGIFLPMEFPSDGLIAQINTERLATARTVSTGMSDEYKGILHVL